MLRKLLSIALIAVMTVTLIPMSFSASAAMNIDLKATNTPPVRDGKISITEYGGNAPIVLNGSGKIGDQIGKYDAVGHWNEKAYNGLEVSYYFTWDSNNFYWAVTVKNDNTDCRIDMSPFNLENSASGGGNNCWRDCDGYQILLNPGMVARNQQPIKFSGNFEDKPTITAFGYRSKTSGQHNDDLTNTGVAKTFGAANVNGFSYVTEVAIPWSAIFVSGIDATGEALKTCDFTKLSAKEGLQIGLAVVYVDQTVYLDNGPTDTDWNQERLYISGAPASLSFQGRDCNFLMLNLKGSSPVTVVKGDFNNDGRVTPQDGTLLLRYLAGWKNVTTVTVQNADFNGDGKIAPQDGTLLLRYLAGWKITL